MQRRKFSATVGTALATFLATLILGASISAAETQKTLMRFGIGGTPESALIADSAGNLYGTTYAGGFMATLCWNGGVSYGCGTVFQLTLRPDGTWAKRTLHTFTSGSDGRNPQGALVFDGAGNLYGTTGDWYSAGTVFKLTPNLDGTWSKSVLHSFTGGPDGYWPRARLIFDAAGNLYGTTRFGGDSQSGGGTVFELTPNSDGSWSETVLYAFKRGTDGGCPVGALVFDAAGNLYGTTACGGGVVSEYGTVFKLARNADGTWTEQILHRFTGGKDGSIPSAGLIFDAAGNLYGTTQYGGAYHCPNPINGYDRGCGVLFKLAPNSDGSWTEHVVHMFTGGNDGAFPQADLAFDTSGNLYTTATKGGASGYGVVFKLHRTAAGGWAEKVLWSFQNRLGAYPYAGLLIDPAGNLYGTTAGDGIKTFGTVFEITP